MFISACSCGLTGITESTDTLHMQTLQELHFSPERPAAYVVMKSSLPMTFAVDISEAYFLQTSQNRTPQFVAKYKTVLADRAKDRPVSLFAMTVNGDLQPFGPTSLTVT
ncbi:hypothetical protein VTP01DRAFT_6391 [Rhizomucor pusillus]|uniref:uncharacterized protein n=1 Tax=Rhizomucor pusillus TaxID=4840 RepID=UPI0037435DB7